MKKFWNDEAGAIISAELVLVLTITVIAMVVGLSSVRDAVVTELADIAQAIANVDQTYTVCGVDGHSSAVSAFGYVDDPDYCDTQVFAAGENSKCVSVCGGTDVSVAASTDGE